MFRKGGDNVQVNAGSSASLNGVGDVLRIVNSGSIEVYFRVGVGAQTPTTADVFLLKGEEILLQIDFADDTIAVRTASGGQVQVMRGSAS